MKIGFDSQCLSFLIDATQGISEPTDPLAQEKVALYRTYLYSSRVPYVTPTVSVECARIKDVDRRELHDQYVCVLLNECQIDDEDHVKTRALELGKHHDGDLDCRILAEAEEAELNALLTYDRVFLNRLKGIASAVSLVRPTDHWASLNIPRGAQPKRRPDITNPLAGQTWWRW